MKRFAALGAIRLSAALRELGYLSVFDDYSTLLDRDITPALLEQYLSIPVFEGVAGGTAQLLALLGSEPLVHTAFELAVLRYMDEQISGAFILLCPSCAGFVTAELAVRVLYPREDIFSRFTEMRSCFEILSPLLEITPRDTFFRSHLALDDRLAGFLCGNSETDRALCHIASLFPAGEALEPIQLYDAALDRATARLREAAAPLPVIQIIGQAHSGRKFTARHLAARLGVPLLLADGNYLLGEPAFQRRTTRKLLRECLLTGAWLGIYGFQDSAVFPALRTGIFQLLEELPQRTALLVLSGEDFKLLPFLSRQLYLFPLPKPDYAQSELLWRAFSREVLGENGLNCGELAAKMRLAPGVIRKILCTAKDRSSNSPVNDRQIYRICYEVLDEGQYDNIKRVNSGYRWEDLMLAPPQKNILQDICNQANYRFRVMNHWGMQSKYPYGYCISALFCGSPGTGKTMAVHVIASMLRMELYKVDLSQIADKYIGETEKRLEEVFSRAEKTNVILFFDEADAVLGKRSEVHEAKDKYANTEVSYLLQRIEEYDGIVIMATNNLQNIDKAFLRRIRYVVNFPMPDEQTRKAIWMSSFTAAVPRENIDFDFLAEKFEFSGGAIKNAVLNAVSYAAAENRPVSMAHMVKAVQRELVKDTKVNFTDAFRTYSYLAEPI